MTLDKRNQIRLRLSIVAWLLAACAAGVSAATVEEMFRSYPVRRGVACVPACGDGAVALELARTSEFLILALDEDAAKVASLKKEAAAAGFLGRNLYVEQGSLEALPLADAYVDLMALSHVAKAGLSGKAREEIERVLVPIHGKAFFKDGVIEKPELPGSDWWMHQVVHAGQQFCLARYGVSVAAASAVSADAFSQRLSGLGALRARAACGNLRLGQQGSLAFRSVRPTDRAQFLQRHDPVGRSHTRKH